MRYSIGKDAVYESKLLSGDCASAISGIDIAMATSRTPEDAAARDLIRLAYGLDKSAIAGSNIWDGPSSTIEVCQVVRLVLPSDGTRPKMVITEEKRKLNIDLNLSVGFTINV